MARLMDDGPFDKNLKPATAYKAEVSGSKGTRTGLADFSKYCKGDCKHCSYPLC